MVHHDEPARAAVRRRPRPQGGEPRRRQGRRSRRRRRRDARRDRDDVEPPTVLPEPRATTRTRANDCDGRHRSGEGRDEAVPYDTDGDGVCDDGGACNDILFMGRNVDPWPEMDQVAMASLQIGLPGLKLRELDTSTGYTTMQTMKKLVPISISAGLGEGLREPVRVRLLHLRHRRHLACTGSSNYSNVGHDRGPGERVRRRARSTTRSSRTTGEVPSVDDEDGRVRGEARGVRSTPASPSWTQYLMEDDRARGCRGCWAKNWTSLDPSGRRLRFDQSPERSRTVTSAVDNGLQPENVAASTGRSEREGPPRRPPPRRREEGGSDAPVHRPAA